MRTKVWTKTARKDRMGKVVASGPRGVAGAVRAMVVLAITLNFAVMTVAQAVSDRASTEGGLSRSLANETSPEVAPVAAASLTRRFLGGRSTQTGEGAARQLATARAQHAALVEAQRVRPRTTTLGATWAPVGPRQIASLAYGKISGRVSSIAIDPSDPTGNTVYVGTTGGGVWKSTNAAGVPESVTFVPLTDNLPVFAGSAGSSATASLSIGAISVQAGGTVLAGTGDPNDASDSYYGSGILRSTDGGLTWTLIRGSNDGANGGHLFTGLGFAGFAWSTVNSGLVVAALSQSTEGSIVNAPVRDSVMGLYVSSDAGATWSMATISDGTQTVQEPKLAGANVGGVAATAVVWNAVRQRFYAAVRYHGYYESADGLSWSRLAHQPGAGMSAKACPTNNGTTGGGSCPVFRGALSVQAGTGDLFAITTDRNNIDQGVWQDVCGASGGQCSSSTVMFGNRIVSDALEAGSGSAVIPHADYGLSIAAEATGSDTLLFVATGDLYRCSMAEGCLLRNTTNATNACAAPARVAPAQHAIATLGSANLLYLGNDSGLWRSTDNVAEQGSPCSPDDATHFDNLNSGLGSLAEIVSFAQDPQDPGSVLAGLGASGTVSLSSTSDSAWQQVSAGEGGTVAIDPSNPLLWYISTAGGVSIRGCSLGARCGPSDFAGQADIGASQTSADASLLDAPWILDPAFDANVMIGTCRVWRGPAASGGLWSRSNQVSATLGGPQNSACDPTTNPFARSLAAAGPAALTGPMQNKGSQVLYAGMAGRSDGGGVFAGHVFATFAGDMASSTTRWVDLANSKVTNDQSNTGRFNPGGFDISSLSADSHDATGNTLYATVMGFGGNGISAPHLYGSTDGGSHWLNLTSNLPNAPANSVLVDPNDANTLYVAMDTGVYVTTQVTNCALANCWSVYGASLPNAPVTQLAAASGMPTRDGRLGVLRAGTYGRGIWEIPLLTAALPAQPAMALSPTSLAFDDQAVGTLSAGQTVTVTNTGNAPLIVNHTAATGDFRVSDGCVGSPVAANASCSIRVQFVPSTQGVRTGLLTVYANVSGGQATGGLSGRGTAPGSIVLTPMTLSFPDTTINATTAGQDIVISNVGGSTATLQPPAITGDFRVTATTCGPALAQGTACTVSVAFSPSASGIRTGFFTIDGGSGTQAASLSGRGSTPATDSISTMSVVFGAQPFGTSSSAQQVVLTNAGDVPLTLISAKISSGDFQAVNGCGSSLNAHSSCTIQVTYVPRSVGAGTGVLVVSDQFRSQAVSLNGMGVAPPGVSLSPTGAMVFPATVVGTRSSAQTVTLTNNGGVPLNFQSITLSGDFAFASGGTCGTALAPSASCTFQVLFAPSAGGSRAGSLTLTDNALTSTQTLGLTGAGIDFTLAADGGTSATIASGKTAVYPLLLSSAGGMSGSVALSCTGAPLNSTCVISPANVALGSTTLVKVTVTTGVMLSASTGGSKRPGRGTGSSVLLAGALPLGMGLLLRRRRTLGVTALLALVCVLAGGGCGAAREIPAPGSSAPGQVALTPTGDYTLTVAATSSGLTRTIGLNLTVQ